MKHPGVRRSAVDPAFSAKMDQTGAVARDHVEAFVSAIRYHMQADPADMHGTGPVVLGLIAGLSSKATKGMLAMTLRLLAETDWRRPPSTSQDRPEYG